VLLALSPNDAALNERVVALALEALGHLPETELVVKLHPGQGSWHWLDATLRDFARRVRVTRHEPLYPLLADSAVTLVHRTTVVIESLAASVPVIVVGAGQPNAREDLPALDLPIATAGEELAGLVTRYTQDREAFFRDRTAALRDALGPLDGDAAGRVARLLLNGVA
jgi:hypothetical protein